MARIALVLPLILAACVNDGTKPVGGIECGAVAPNVQLRAVDAISSAALPFGLTVGGAAPTAASCDPMAASDAPCPGTLTFLLFGAADVAVSSNGHGTATVHLDGGRVGDDCSAPAYSFDLWVPLQPE
jgi:hypothetical protein